MGGGGGGRAKLADLESAHLLSIVSTHGLPPSASDSFFDNDSPAVQPITPLHFSLGFFVSSPSTKSLRYLFLTMRRPPPTLVIIPMNRAQPRVLFSPSSVMRPSPSTCYAGLGHGLPSHMRTTSPRAASGSTVSSVRLSYLVPSLSYFPSAARDRLSSLIRSPPIGVLSRICTALALRVRALEGAQGLKRAWGAACARFVGSKYIFRKAGAGELNFRNLHMERQVAEVHVGVVTVIDPEKNKQQIKSV
ncbi:hypothetical protein B0H17DRAFT_1052071 [Mycena rosella]|uniref:Uncharacterized protein n=1 Tax=Mycena rosella TaxID=1033263 RepID=A0AAD7DQJ7_MYCRO|nr:hypothetical protein B0H17DRAFT_1052071 [Mycena rosella]